MHLLQSWVEQASPRGRRSPSRRGSSDAEHAGATLSPNFDSLLEAAAQLEHTEQAPNGATTEAAGVPIPSAAAPTLHTAQAGTSSGAQQPPARLLHPTVAADAQPPAPAAPRTTGVLSVSTQQLSAQGQAELLAQMRMAQNNKAAHAGGSAPASLPAHPNQASQPLAGAGLPGQPGLPRELPRAQPAASTASAPAQHRLLSQPVTMVPAAARPQQLPVTYSLKRNKKEQQQQQRLTQQRPAKPAASAQRSTSTAQMAAVNKRFMAELQPRASGFLGLPANPSGPPQPQPQRPALPLRHVDASALTA